MRGALVATGGTKTNISVTYDDANNNMDFVVASDLNTSGNAGTATALATARNIGGVSFDGTSNIDLPGVNTAGTQNTSGTSSGVDGTELEVVSQTTAVDAAGEAEGSIIKFGNDSTTAGKVYTFFSGTWTEVDADGEDTTRGLLAMALGSNSSTNGMLVHGVGYLNHDPGAAGKPLFISNTPGQLTETAPTDASDFVRGSRLLFG